MISEGRTLVGFGRPFSRRFGFVKEALIPRGSDVDESHSMAEACGRTQSL